MTYCSGINQDVAYILEIQTAARNICSVTKMAVVGFEPTPPERLEP